MLEEAVFGTAGGGAPGEDTEIGGGVEGEGEQVEADQEVGQGLLAVAEAVLEVVALEHVEGLVLDLPSGTAARGQFGDAVRGDRQVGHEGVVVDTLARAAEDLDGHPVDAHGIGGAAQRDLAQPAIDAGGLPAALDDGLPVLREVDAGEVFGDGLVRVRLAGQDEAAAALPDGLDDRLAGVELVAQVDRPEAGDAGAMAGQPALGGGALAILLASAVLGRDELRRQRQDLGMAGGDHTGAQEGVETLHAAIRAPACRALWAADLARTVVLGAVERDQQPTAQALERRKAAATVSSALMNRPSKAPGELPSSIWRMWLSLGMA